MIPSGDPLHGVPRCPGQLCVIPSGGRAIELTKHITRDGREALTVSIHDTKYGKGRLAAITLTFGPARNLAQRIASLVPLIFADELEATEAMPPKYIHRPSGPAPTPGVPRGRTAP